MFQLGFLIMLLNWLVTYIYVFISLY